MKENRECGLDKDMMYTGWWKGGIRFLGVYTSLLKRVCLDIRMQMCCFMRSWMPF